MTYKIKLNKANIISGVLLMGAGLLGNLSYRNPVEVFAVPTTPPGQSTQCPSSTGWVKEDLTGDPLSYSYTAPSGYLISESCYKASTTLISDSYNPPVSSVTLTSSVYNKDNCPGVSGCNFQALSNVNFLLVTPTPTVSPSPTVTPTVTLTLTPTVTPTVTPSSTPTVTPTLSPTATPTSSPTATPSVTSTPTVSPTATLTPTTSPTSTPTATPTPTETVESAEDPGRGGLVLGASTLPSTDNGKLKIMFAFLLSAVSAISFAYIWRK